ncbi:hypothetical protein KR222_006462, partial [Zaprionus bogoriensis]
HSCVPVCSKGCENGVCVAPDKCNCKNGYKFNELNARCTPICANGCKNGDCQEPGKCICNEGYEKQFSIVFSSKPVAQICMPKCDVRCGPGRSCVEPNKCACSEGYVELDDNCVPVCSKGCGNGVCVAPDKCNCKNGYKFNELNARCTPMCANGCKNGYWQEPGKCICNEGYEKKFAIVFSSKPVAQICMPKCDVHCGPGRSCVEPNKCACTEGYVELY